TCSRKPTPSMNRMATGKGPPWSGWTAKVGISPSGVRTRIVFSAMRLKSSPRRRPAAASALRLLEADQVARGVAEGAVADAVELVHRLLEHLAAARPDVLE